MTWDLIDPKAVKVIEIQGVKIHIRPLSGADKASMGLYWHEESDGSWAADLVKMSPYLARAIVKIEGFENRKVSDVLEQIEIRRFSVN